jgi:GAF domain-containing protein
VSLEADSKAELQQTIADLRRVNTALMQMLDERTAQRDGALDQQTATAEVLQVINTSPGDLARVFDAMLERAMRLCVAAFGGLWTFEGDRYVAVALRNVPPAYADFLAEQTLIPGPGTAPHRFLMGGERGAIHNLDVATEEPYRAGDPQRLALVDLGGARTALQVPLCKDDAVLGVITIYRKEVRPFSNKEIELVRIFAAQTVIAMENARLITETQEALDQQTATADVLGVINSSPSDLIPVFDAILEKAHSLCGATRGALMIREGERFRAVATRGLSDAFVALLRGPQDNPPGSPRERLLSGERLVHIPDFRDLAIPTAAVELEGARTVLFVPLRKEGTLLGYITAYRQEVRPFTDKQITLLESFAAQAVIAMENARLITETREALEQQIATAEVLGVINSSPGELAPVFEAMLEKALRLCEVDIGTLWMYDGEMVHAAAIRGAPPQLTEFLTKGPYRPAKPQQRVLSGGERLVQIADITATEAYRDHDLIPRAIADLGGVRTLLIVPVRKDNVALGNFAIYRCEVRPFTEKQIALLENFATQAAIAIENARLITETREALDQQTATAEVLQVINSSPGDLVPVFEAMLDKAMRLCEASFGAFMSFDGDLFHRAAHRGLPVELVEENEPLRPVQGSALARIVGGGSVVHIHDLSDTDAYRAGYLGFVRLVEQGGARTAIWMALRKDDALLGVAVIYRQEVRPYTDKQIALLQNFATQAVIAMENARLITETREALEQQTATAEVLGVINASPGDLGPVFDAMLEKALRLCEASFGNMIVYDGTKERSVAVHGAPLFARWLAERGAVEPAPGSLADRLVRGEKAVHIIDAATEAAYVSSPTRRAVVEIGGFRTLLGVPLRKGDILLGAIVVYRKEVRPFTEKEIALLENFAAQAVIAMENARLITETREARDHAEVALRDLKAAQASLIQAEKMASLGQLTAGIAHEIKNPLNFVNNFASLSVELLDELKEATGPAVAALGDDKRAEVDETMVMLTGNLEKIAEHGKRADNIVKSMLEHSRGVSGERREVDLNGVIEEALNLAYHGARAQDQSFNITLERDYAESLKPIELAPQEMTRVFLNLFGNGFYAANKRARDNGDGSFRPVLTVRTREDSDAVEIRVRDNGTGIPPEVKDRLFQPFFTTKPTGEGTGLGLSISYDIITQQHGGTITVESEPGSYTEFTVRLPRH